jgi:HEAT repeat protein
VFTFLTFFPSASDALGKIGDKRALEPLTRLKDDDDDYVQRVGKEAIEKIQANNSDNAA